MEIMELERRLQKQTRSLQLCVAFLAIAVLVLFATAFDRSERHDQVLRVRGLVIEDAQGRERILIGAPIPEAKNRVRTDLVRVKSAWAGGFPSPDQYIQSYKAYRNDMNGILILDADGFDRVAVGDPVPDPNVGRRISPSSGLVINDEKGFERSGYGLLKVDNRHRVVLGMDDTQSKEGLTLFLIDDGPIGLEVNDGTRHRSLGLRPK
jgi:hypothetical protein